jgi:hypothetical protein
MQSIPVLLNMAAVCSMLLTACMKGPDTRNCSLTTGEQTAPGDGTVTYHITHSHRAFLRSLTYQGTHGPVMLDTPKLPFTVSFPVSKDALIKLSAEGTVMEGNLVAGYRYTGVDGVVSKSDTCGK